MNCAIFMKKRPILLEMSDWKALVRIGIWIIETVYGDMGDSTL